MGCFSSVNINVVGDKKESNIKPLNKTEIENFSYEARSCGNDGDDTLKKDNFNLNINNVPFDAIKSYKYYFTNKNYKSLDLGEEEKQNKRKLQIIKINKKKDKKEINDNINKYKIIEDMDVNIKEYQKYIKKNNKEDIPKESSRENKETFENTINTKINNNNNNRNRKNNDVKLECKALRKSIEERITKFSIKNENDKNMEYNESLCNLGQSYIKEKK